MTAQIHTHSQREQLTVVEPEMVDRELTVVLDPRKGRRCGSRREANHQRATISYKRTGRRNAELEQGVWSLAHPAGQRHAAAGREGDSSSPRAGSWSSPGGREDQRGVRSVTSTCRIRCTTGRRKLPWSGGGKLSGDDRVRGAAALLAADQERSEEDGQRRRVPTVPHAALVIRRRFQPG